jgi:oligoribonuclease NrnB/cAMP/cGMP phosphodiesterase (DHH superfamily)
MITTTILYHNDADGFASALAAWLRYGNNAHYIEVAYGKPVPTIPAGTVDLFILDFSYSREVCDLLASQYRLVVLDHHKTAQAALADAPYAIFDMSKAGCELAWEHFFPAEPLPELLAYVADRDLWLWELPLSKEVNAWISTLPKRFDEWALSLRSGINQGMVMCGQAVLANQANLLEIMASGAKFIEIAGLPAVVVNSTQALHSELADFLGQRFPGAAVVAIYQDQGNGTRKYSLRTTSPDVDVSAIARQYGGGGHRKAAGFELPPYSYPSELCMGGELSRALESMNHMEQMINLRGGKV